MASAQITSNRNGSEPIEFVSREVEAKFLKAASNKSVGIIKSMLQNREVTVRSVLNPTSALSGGRPLVSVALSRLSNCLDGVKLLIDEYKCPIPDNLLTSTKTRDVAEYLIFKKGINPYAEYEKNEKLPEDQECPFFSSSNIDRYKNPDLHRTLRPGDAREIGDALNKILDVLVTGVRATEYSRLAPNIICSTEDEAQRVTEFLKVYDKDHCSVDNESCHSDVPIEDFILHVTKELQNRKID